MVDYRIVFAVILGLFVLMLAVFFLVSETNPFASPQEICARQGMIYDSELNVCLPAGGIDDSCAPIISTGRCQLGLTCELSPLNIFEGFFVCRGSLEFP